MKVRTVAAITALLVALLPACSPTGSPGALGPAIPTGATTFPGDALEPTPTASSPKVPGSQHEAQDTAVGYLQRTLDGLPPGTTMVVSAAGGGSNLSCDDNHMGPGSGPTEYTAAVDVVGPPQMAPVDLVPKVGDLWRSWGLTVMQRKGFEQPNQFGYPSDGYRVQIEAAHPLNYPPTLTVISPCFPGELRRDDIPMQKRFEQTSLIAPTHTPGGSTQSIPPGTYTLRTDGARLTIDGHPQSGGMPNETTWKVAQCGTGCAHIQSSLGWGMDLHLVNAHWQATRVIASECLPTARWAITYALDATTLSGTVTSELPCDQIPGRAVVPATLTRVP